MAVALVGSAGAVATGTTSCAPAFGQSPTAGNFLVAFVGAHASGTAITSAAGWSNTSDSGRGGNIETLIYYKENCSAGQAAPTFNCAGGTDMAAVLAEFSGVLTASSLSNFGTITSSVITSPVTVTSGGTDAASGYLAVAVCFSLATAGKAGTETIANSLTEAASTISLGNNGASSLLTHIDASYAITTTNSAAIVDTGTSSGMNLIEFIGSMASFKSTVVAATRVPYVNVYRPLLPQ